MWDGMEAVEKAASAGPLTVLSGTDVTPNISAMATTSYLPYERDGGEESEVRHVISVSCPLEQA